MLIADTYAQGLFDAAKEDGSIQQVKESFLFFLTQVNQNKDYQKLLFMESLAVAKRKEMIAQVFQKYVHPNFLYFLYVLLDHGRIKEVGSIYESFLNFVDESNGLLSIVVSTCEPLTESQSNELKIALMKKYQTKIEIHTMVDPNILCGIICKVHGSIIDDSVIHQLDELKKKLSKEV